MTKINERSQGGQILYNITSCRRHLIRLDVHDTDIPAGAKGLENSEVVNTQAQFLVGIDNYCQMCQHIYINTQSETHDALMKISKYSVANIYPFKRECKSVNNTIEEDNFLVNNLIALPTIIIATEITIE